VSNPAAVRLVKVGSIEVGLSRIGSLNNDIKLWIMAGVQDNSLR
jgi:hypothetical protein